MNTVHKTSDFNVKLANQYLLNEQEALEMQRLFSETHAVQDSGQPLISVLLPVHNAASYIETSVLSCVYQTYRNLEIIVVDDGSSDDTQEILQRLRAIHPCIHVVTNKDNQGLISALNTGLIHCKGKYTARMDADDVCLPDRFEKQFRILEEQADLAAVCSWLFRFQVKQPLETVKFSADFQVLKSNLFFYCPLPHPAAFFRTEVIKKLAYRPEYKIAEDYDLWRRLFKVHAVSVVQEELLMYRQHMEQSTHTGKHDFVKAQLKMIANDLFNDIRLKAEPDELEGHLVYCMMNRKIENASVFVKLDIWLNKLLKHISMSGFIPEDIFAKHVFKQRWVDLYMEFRHDFTLKERSLLYKSAFNYMDFKQQLKDSFTTLIGNR